MFNVYDARDFRVQIISKGSGFRTFSYTEHLQSFENNDTIYYFLKMVSGSLSSVLTNMVAIIIIFHNNSKVQKKKGYNVYVICLMFGHVWI